MYRTLEDGGMGQGASSYISPAIELVSGASVLGVGVGLAGRAWGRHSAVGGTATSLAATGATIGTAIVPGIGTAIGAVVGAIYGGVAGARGAAKAHEKRGEARHKAIRAVQMIELEEASKLGEFFFTPAGKAAWEAAVAARMHAARVTKRIVGWDVEAGRKRPGVGSKGWLRLSSNDPLSQADADPELLGLTRAQHGYTWARMAMEGNVTQRRTQYGVRIYQASTVAGTPVGVVPSGPVVVGTRERRRADREERRTTRRMEGEARRAAREAERGARRLQRGSAGAGGAISLAPYDPGVSPYETGAFLPEPALAYGASYVPSGESYLGPADTELLSSSAPTMLVEGSPPSRGGGLGLLALAAAGLFLMKGKRR